MENGRENRAKRGSREKWDEVVTANVKPAASQVSPRMIVIPANFHIIRSRDQIMRTRHEIAKIRYRFAANLIERRCVSRFVNESTS